MLECCLSGRAQSDLVLASILRVVMAVMASPPTTGAGDSGQARPHARRENLCICLLLIGPQDWGGLGREGANC